MIASPLRKSGFTGTRTDSLGRRRKYVNGKPVRLDAPPPPSQGDTAKPQSGASPVAPSRRSAAKMLAEIGKRAEALEGDARAWADRQIGKLPRVPAALIRGAIKLSFASYQAAGKAVRAVAKERGLSDEQADRVAKACAIADVVLGGKALPAALRLAGAGPWAIAGSFVPVGSLSYLALSSARDPVAVLRAAKQAMKKAPAAKSLRSVQDEALRRKPSELWLAAFCLALDETGDAARAMSMADGVERP